MTSKQWPEGTFSTEGHTRASTLALMSSAQKMKRKVREKRGQPHREGLVGHIARGLQNMRFIHCGCKEPAHWKRPRCSDGKH